VEAGRYFTPQQANAALREVRPLAERMVELDAALEKARDRRDGLVQKIGGNGGSITREELQQSRRAVRRIRADLVACIDEIRKLGAVVKDPATGLLDFPARRGNEEVLLCWRVGEPEIAFWHSADAGFAGRRPLDELDSG
jgi:hypothetical protein